MTKDTKFEIQTAMTKNIQHPLPSRGDSNLVLSGMQSVHCYWYSISSD